MTLKFRFILNPKVKIYITINFFFDSTVKKTLIAENLSPFIYEAKITF